MTPLIFEIVSHVNNKELELISIIHILIDIARLLPFWTMVATIDNGMSRNISIFKMFPIVSRMVVSSFMLLSLSAPFF